MKTLLQVFLGVIFFLLVTLHMSAQEKKPTYSKIDFFEVKYLTPDYVNLNSRRLGTGYTSIPELIYDKKGVGMASIVCLPHDPKAWQAGIKKIQDSLRVRRKVSEEGKIIHPRILKIATDLATQKKHTIYAFYTREQDVALQSDLQDKVRMPQYPSFVYVYKRVGASWRLSKSISCKDEGAYLDLRRAIVVPK